MSTNYFSVLDKMQIAFLKQSNIFLAQTNNNNNKNSAVEKIRYFGITIRKIRIFALILVITKNKFVK